MGAAAHLDPAGVAGHQPDGRHLDLQGVGHDLDEAGLVALAGRLGAGQHLHRPVLGDGHRHPLAHRAHGGFHIVGKADAAQPPARLAFGPPGREPLPVGHGQRPVHAVGEVAGVVGEAGGGAIGQLDAAHQVAPAELDAVHAQASGGHVEQPLDDEMRLGPASAAVGRGRRGVCQDGPHAQVRDGDVMNRGGDPLVVVQRHIGDGVRPGVPIHLALQGQDAALRVEGQAGTDVQPPALVVADEGLAAGGGPAHRPAQPPGGPDHQQLLQIKRGARAEPPAGVGADHLDLLDGCGERLRQLLALAYRALASRGQAKDAALHIVFADGRAGLHLAGHNPTVLELALDHQMRGVERARRRFRIAEVLAEAEVAGAVVVELRRSGRDRVVGLHHHRQRTAAHHHQLGRRQRLFQGLGHHHGHCLADVAHAIDGQRHVAPVETGLAAKPRRGGVDRVGGDGVVLHRGVAVGEIVGAGQHRDHAGRRGGGRDVYRLEVGVGLVRAHEGGVGRAGDGDVVGVAPAPGDEPQILEPRDRLADQPAGAQGRALIHSWRP